CMRGQILREDLHFWNSPARCLNIASDPAVPRSDLRTGENNRSANVALARTRNCETVLERCLKCKPTAQARESSDKPILNAFCRVAPSVRFSVLAMRDAVFFCWAIVLKVRTCSAVQARRFVA